MSTFQRLTRSDYARLAHMDDAGHAQRCVTNAPARSFTGWVDHTEQGWQA